MTTLELPSPLQVDTEEGPSNLARIIGKKRSSNHFGNFGKRTSADSRASLTPSVVPPPVDSEVASISLEANATLPRDKTRDKDEYRWAIIHENQRGVSVWRIPRYGPNVLLPSDPAPFTILSTPGSSPNETDRLASLDDFQLPSPEWTWVSPLWMVDMGGDGDVCSSGFQYNWSFSRKSGWRSHPGKLSFGGLVRRRRWVRLMVRHASSISKDSVPPEEVGWRKLIKGRDGKGVEMFADLLSKEEVNPEVIPDVLHAMVYSASKDGVISLFEQAGGPHPNPSSRSLPEDRMAPSHSFDFWRPSISEDAHRPPDNDRPSTENNLINGKVGNAEISQAGSKDPKKDLNPLSEGDEPSQNVIKISDL